MKNFLKYSGVCAFVLSPLKNGILLEKRALISASFNKDFSPEFVQESICLIG